MSQTNDVSLAELPRPDYKYITTTEEALRHIEFIERHPVIEVDTEATGLDPFTAKVVLLQLGVNGKSFVFDVRKGNVEPSMFKHLLESKQHLKLLQNAVFDYEMLKTNFNIELNRVYDTMLAEQLLYLGLHRKAGLSHLVAKYLHLNMPKDIGKTFQNYNQEYQEYQLRYAANDVVVLKDIYNLQLLKLRQDDLMRAAQLEFDFVKPMAEMELNGMLLDVPQWRGILDEMVVERDRHRIQLSDAFSRTMGQTTLFGVSLLNLDSPAQVIKCLNNLGVGVESSDVKELKKHEKNPIVKLLLDYRKYSKFITTYGEPMIDRIHPLTGRLHTRFKQMVDTGRMSSSNPNLQNIPKEQKYRQCFVARPGYKLITSDLSQCELRILAAYSEDPVFSEAFSAGMDLHTRTAADLFGLTYDEVIIDKKLSDGDPNKRNYRGNVKALNFGLCVSEDARLITTNGIKKIRDIDIGDVVADDMGFNKVIDFKYNGKKEIFEIETKYGYSVKVTENHELKVIDKNGNYIDKELRHIDVDNDYLCIKIGSNIFSDKLVKFKDPNVERNTNFKYINLPKVLDKTFAAFLGLFVSEGNVKKAKNHRKYYSTVQFGFSSKNKFFIKAIDRLLESIFNNGLTRYEKPGKVQYSISSVRFAEFLIRIFGIEVFNDKCEFINVPECIKQSPKNIQAEFFRWLFEGDGCIKANGNNYKITYSNKSRMLISDLQLMLLNFGIMSSITEETRKEYEGEIYYLLTILAEFNIFFMSEIGFVSDIKNSRYEEIDQTKSSYFLPNQNNRLSKVKELIGPVSRLDRYIYDVIYNCMNYTKGIGNKYLRDLYKYDEFFTFIHKNNIATLPIKSIRSVGVKKVYDISVQNSGLFLANGIIVHNCYGLTKVGLALRMGVSEREAQKLIDMYFSKYSRVKKWLDCAARSAVMDRYSTSRSGRRRYYRLPDPSDKIFNKIKGSIERQGMNMPIQATNADVIKQNMIYIVNRIKPYDARLLLTVHDEVIVEAREDQAEEVSQIVSQAMCDGFAEFVPEVKMTADADIADYWVKG
jgi:DNA polymerase-1